jgi:hypothetical protein
MAGRAFYQTSKIRVGLHRLGLVGFREACEDVRDAGIEAREQVVERLAAILASRNYVPPLDEEYRLALWREYLRFRGRDISGLFTELPVTLRAAPGEERERLAEHVRGILADLELAPRFEEEPAPEGAPPELLIEGDLVARGALHRPALERAILVRITEW